MNLSKATEEFIETHPCVKDCLSRGLINYSSLARLIAKEYKIEKGFDALLVACRRYAEKLKPAKTLEGKILKIIKKSSIEVKDAVGVLVLDFRVDMERLSGALKSINHVSYHLIQGEKHITLISAEKAIEKIALTFRHFITKKRSGLIQLSIKSPEAIETTPGVVSFLYALLASKGINVVEQLSTWTDTIFILHEKDLGKAVEILKVRKN